MYIRPVVSVLYVKWELRNAAELWVVPKPLGVVAAAPSKGRTFSYFGYEFESPWTEIKRERKFNSVVVLNYSSGQFISFFDPAQNVNELEVMRQGAESREWNFGQSSVKRLRVQDMPCVPGSGTLPPGTRAYLFPGGKWRATQFSSSLRNRG